MDKKVPRLYEKCNARVIVEVNFSSARVELVSSAPPTPFYFHLLPSLLPPLLATRSIFFRADTSANRSTISFRSECHTTLWKPALKTSVRDVPHKKRNRDRFLTLLQPCVCTVRTSFRTTIHLLAASGGSKRYQTADETTRRHFRHLETVYASRLLFEHLSRSDSYE